MIKHHLKLSNHNNDYHYYMIYTYQYNAIYHSMLYHKFTHQPSSDDAFKFTEMKFFLGGLKFLEQVPCDSHKFLVQFSPSWDRLFIFIFMNSQ